MTDPGVAEDERAMLVGFLDWFRLVAENKVVDLSLDDATRVTTPTGMSLLGVIKHLTWTEAFWFQRFLLGTELDLTSNADSFVIGPDDTVESVLAGYREGCAVSRANQAAAPSLDTLSVWPHHFFGHVSLRWMLIHMVEETARHAGHLDILRELTDGRVGD